jgi:23S rRNA-/tRNA-specific pseudouridylate synthase
MKTKDPLKKLQAENEVLKNDNRYLKYENRKFQDIVNRMDMELRGMMLVAKSLKPSAETKKKALKILVAMIQSQPASGVDRSQVDAKAWARKAYEFADALEAEGGKQ